jgi:mono/diheme cytochrome c family protein
MSDAPNNPNANPPDGESRDTYEKTRFEDHHLQSIHGQLLREKEEPTENFSPMPLIFVALFMILSFWGGIYLVWYSGDFGPFHYNEKLAPGDAIDEGPREVDMLALGRRVYSQNCVACHQSNGQGIPGIYPSLVNVNWVQDNPEMLIKVILGGLAGPITVNGQEYNNAMTPFGRLNDQQVAAVLTLIRTDDSFNNNSYEVTPELVAKVRADYGSRAEPWTQSELEDIHGPITGDWSPSSGNDGSAEDKEDKEAEEVEG